MTLRRPPTLSETAAEAIGLIQSGKHKQAERILKQVLKADPGHFDALQGLAAISAMGGKYGEAVRLLTRAVLRNPDSVSALLNIATAEMMQNRAAEAETAAARAAALAPTNPNAHDLLGQSQHSQGKLAEAVASYVRAAELAPGNPELACSALALKQKVCDWDGIASLETAVVTSVAQGRAVEPFLLLHVSDDGALLRRNAEIYWRNKVLGGQPPRKPMKRQQAVTGTRSRIRIGYLSADFREHAMAHLLVELFERHNRERFEVYGFSYGRDDGSQIGRRVRGAFDRLVDVRGATDEQFAARIAAHEIDIAIDLMGHTNDARLAVLALRPAPVQCHFLGYPGTIGGTALDYVIVDPVVAPPGAEPHFSETVVRLPDCYQVNDRKRVVSLEGASRQQHGLPDGAFVFCSFNGQQKLTLGTFDIWGRILTAVPGSVLWLYSDHPLSTANLRKEVQARGVDPARLVIAGKLPHAEHLGRLRLADLMLDSLPYGGHTTGSDALWVGLPVLTCPGRAFAGRVGTSLLTAMGLPELVAADLADYEAKAIALARDPARLGQLRQRLVASRDTAALFDTDRFARNIEAAYRTMWDRWQRGEAPANIDLTAAVVGEIGTA